MILLTILIVFCGAGRIYWAAWVWQVLLVGGSDVVYGEHKR